MGKIEQLKRKRRRAWDAAAELLQESAVRKQPVDEAALTRSADEIDRLGKEIIEAREVAGMTTEITFDALYEIYSNAPRLDRRRGHWVMSGETRDRIAALAGVSNDDEPDPTPEIDTLFGLPIKIQPDAEGVRFVIPLPRLPAP